MRFFRGLIIESKQSPSKLFLFKLYAVRQPFFSDYAFLYTISGHRTDIYLDASFYYRDDLIDAEVDD